MADLKALDEQLAAMREDFPAGDTGFVRVVWPDGRGDPMACPWCNRTQEDGHWEECEFLDITKALALAEGYRALLSALLDGERGSDPVCRRCGHCKSAHGLHGMPCLGWMPRGAGHHDDNCRCEGFLDGEREPQAPDTVTYVRTVDGLEPEAKDAVTHTPSLPSGD